MSELQSPAQFLSISGTVFLYQEFCGRDGPVRCLGGERVLVTIETKEGRLLDLETRFVGRDANLDHLLRRVRGDSRVVTITGPPGVGKTRLARELVRALEGGSVDGVLFFEVGELERPGEIDSVVAERLGVLREERDRERVAYALDGLGDIVVILDDVEHLAGDPLVELLRDWLEDAPDLTVVLTSRSRLGAAFEQCQRLGPLPLDAAVELFEARARRVSPEFEVNADNRDDVVELVEELDRLPLAIKLAGGRVRILSPAQMLERLHRPFELLDGDESEHGLRSLRRAIETSWESVSEAQRRALRQCSVFRGTFSMEAAEAVVELDAEMPPVLEVIGGLVDHSLLRRVPETGPQGEVRFQMLRSIREFARRRLDETGAADDVRRRHAEHYRGGCRIWEGQRYHPEYLAWNPTVGPEVENLQAALDWYIGKEAPEAGEICSALADFLMYRKNHSGVREIIERTLDAVDFEDRPVLHANLMEALAKAVEVAGETERAQSLRRDALERFEVDEAPRLACNLRTTIGFSHFVQGYFDEASEMLEAAFELADRENFALEKASILSMLGRQKCEAGELDEAERLLKRALRTVESTDAAYLESRIRINYGALMSRRGLPEENLEQVRRGVELVERDGVPFQGTTERANLACALALVGDLEEADEEYERAVGLLRRRGLRREEANTRVDHGLVLLERDEMTRAREEFEAARRLSEPENRAGAFPNLGGAHAGLGIVEGAEGQIEAARASFERAAEFAEDLPTASIGRSFERFLDGARVAAKLGAVRAGAREIEDFEGLREDYRALAAEPTEQFEETLVFRLASRWADQIFDHPLDGGDEEHASGAVDLRIGPEGRWIELDDERLDFSRRGPLRRIVLALAKARGSSDDQGLTTYELLEEGWPEQEISPDSGVNRVYTAISRLRDLGFDGLLRTDDSGYSLAPKVDVEMVERV